MELHIFLHYFFLDIRFCLKKFLCLYDSCVVSILGQVCVPWHACGGQKSALGGVPHLASCLSWNLLLFATLHAKLRGWQAGDSATSVTTLTQMCWDYRYTLLYLDLYRLQALGFKFRYLMVVYQSLSWLKHIPNLLSIVYQYRISLEYTTLSIFIYLN